MIVDAHAHIIPIAHDRGNKFINHYPVESFLSEMDRTGVDKAVLLQGPFYGDFNTFVQAAVADHPERFFGAAYLDPWDQTRPEIELFLETPEFCALKIEFSVGTGLCKLHPDALLDDPAIRWLWKLIEKSGKVLVLDLGSADLRSYQTSAVRDIAENQPELKIIIAHLAQPKPEIIADPVLLSRWEEQIDLGKLPNVWFDCAAIPAFLPNEEFPYPTMEQYLHRAFDRIGSDKVMWGTDIPGLFNSADYPQLLSMGSLHSRILGGKDQENFLSGTALKIFGS